MEEKQDGYRDDGTWFSGQPSGSSGDAGRPVVAALMVVCSIGTVAIVLGALVRWWFW